MGGSGRGKDKKRVEEEVEEDRASGWKTVLMLEGKKEEEWR